MSRHFNTAGPCDPEVHYMLPPERRLPGIRDVIDQQSYFVLHAPRQVGKTTSLVALAKALTAEGRYAALLVSMEVGAAFRGPSLQRVNLSVRDFPGEFAPPLGWPIAALLGVVIAAWFVRRARCVDAMPPGPLADATLGADGALLLADGSTRAVGGGAAPVGPVVVAAATGATAPYRDSAPIDIVRVGTLAQWNDALRDERDVRYALGFSTLVLLGTPMAIAAGLRLLW